MSDKASKAFKDPKDRFGGEPENLVDRLDEKAGELEEKVKPHRMRDILNIIRANRPSRG